MKYNYIIVGLYILIAFVCFSVAFIFLKYKSKMKIYVVKDKDNGERLGAFIDKKIALSFKNRVEIRLGNTCYIDEE